jgi:hypothetical protein
VGLGTNLVEGPVTFVVLWAVLVTVYVIGWAVLLGHLVHRWRVDRWRVSARRQAAVTFWR